MGGLEVEGMGWGRGGYRGPWLNSKSRFRFSFLKKGDWGVKRFRITLIHDLTPHSPLVQPTTALSRVTVGGGGGSLVWETHGEVVVFEQGRRETGSQIRSDSNGSIKKRQEGGAKD